LDTATLPSSSGSWMVKVSNISEMREMVDVLSTPTSFKEKAKRRPSKTTLNPLKAVSSSCAQIRLSD